MSDDKTEEPTPSKLKKAREEGQVAKSADMATAVSMLGVLIALSTMSEGAGVRVRGIVQLAMEFGPGGDLPLLDMYRVIGQMTIQAMLIVAPLALIAALFAALGLMAQIGLVIAMEAVTPKPENIDPVAGMKKIFSVKSLLTFLQTVLKAVVLTAVLWKVIVGLMPLVGGAPYQSVTGIASLSWAALMKVLMISMGLFITLGPLDYAIQRYQFMKGQKMSKDDIKREYKSQEGDPEIKGKRKQIAQEDAQSSPRKAVAGANAVIVNPTHYAVAVRYWPEEHGIPIVVAKGVDAEALNIRRFADQLDVPIFSNPPLARALHKVPIGGAVPEELFETVAAVLRWVDQIGRRPGEVEVS
jgi:type III secretion protein U